MTEGEELESALRRLMARPGEERRALAETARLAALDRHEETMGHWLELLAPSPAVVREAVV